MLPLHFQSEFERNSETNSLECGICLGMLFWFGFPLFGFRWCLAFWLTLRGLCPVVFFLLGSCALHSGDFVLLFRLLFVVFCALLGCLWLCFIVWTRFVFPPFCCLGFNAAEYRPFYKSG